MAKPPKKIPVPGASDTPSTSIRLPVAGEHVDTGLPPPREGVDTVSGPQQNVVVQQPVIVSDLLPDAIAWPAHRINELPPAGSDPGLSQRPGGTAPAPATESPSFIAAHLAATLTKAEISADGIRFDKRKRSYVDLEEGTVMVRRNTDGNYQQTSPNELIPSGPLLEQIPGSTRWRRKAQGEAVEPQADPGKRPRLDEDSDTSSPLDFSVRAWRNWGKLNKPQSGQSIEMDGLHYPIVPQVLLPTTQTAYIEHPRFSPARFDAFEQMLRDDPTLQPQRVEKKDGQWHVEQGAPLFEKPLTHYVAGAVAHLSDQSSSAVARTVFNHSRDAEVINGEGITVLSQTFRHWADRTTTSAPRRELADPLMLLPTLARQNGNPDAGIISLPSPSAESLQRLDFNPQRLPNEWREYTAAPTDDGLQKLFRTLLEHNGYRVGAASHPLSEHALIFYRDKLDAMFVLKLPHVSGNDITRYTRPGSELKSSAFQMKIGEVAWQRLSQYFDKDQIIYLLGGTQALSPQQQTLFIVREG